MKNRPGCRVLKASSSLRFLNRTGPMSSRYLSALVTLGVALTAACGGMPDGPAWQGTVNDSAGVAMVVNPAGGVWGPGDAWTFEEEYRVGGVDAEEAAQFGLVIGMDVDGQGNVYIADQQARQVQVFDAGGTYVRTIGSPGSGPGEISQAMMGVYVMGEDVLVADVANMRVNRYGLDGTSVDASPLDFTRGVPVRWDRVGGSLVAQMRAMAAMGMAENPLGDPVVTLGEETQDTVLVLGKGESLEVTEGGQARFTIFEQEPLWDAAVDGRILSALNSDYRIEVRDADGSLARVITKPFIKQPVSESDQDKILSALRQLMMDQGAPPPAVEQFLAGTGCAESYPAMGQVLAGPAGTVWVQGVRTADDVSTTAEDFNPQDMGSDEWDVFDGEGRYLGVITMPPKFAPLRVDGEAFWGVQRDEFDVNSIVRYRLIMD
jgi:hypothetical protein